jgi:hypothetical protein
MMKRKHKLLLFTFVLNFVAEQQATLVHNIVVEVKYAVKTYPNIHYVKLFDNYAHDKSAIIIVEASVAKLTQ